MVATVKAIVSGGGSIIWGEGSVFFKMGSTGRWVGVEPRDSAQGWGQGVTKKGRGIPAPGLLHILFVIPFYTAYPSGGNHNTNLLYSQNLPELFIHPSDDHGSKSFSFFPPFLIGNAYLQI